MPLGLEKYERINFSLGRWATMGQNAPKLMKACARESFALVRTFFCSLTWPQESLFWRSSCSCYKIAPFWSFLISLAVFSYFSAPVFLTSLPRHCYIAQHCLSMHGGYWCNKNEILIKIWPELLYFLSQFCIFSFQWSILLEFLSNRALWHCGTVAVCFAFTEPLPQGFLGTVYIAATII